MKKISIKYLPHSMEIVTFLVLVEMGVVLFILLRYIENVSSAGAVISGIVLFASAALVEWIACNETAVEYGEGSIIKCRWAFIEWEIDLEKVRTVVYTVEPYYSRVGTVHTLNVEFAYAEKYGEERTCLKTNLDANQIGGFMQGKRDNVPLMQLYRYVEERYPEKAKGFEKSAY